MDYIPYRDDIETVPAGEADTVAAIIDTMTKESQTVARRDGTTVRASHAKSSGLLKGTLQVPGGLPDALRQGLFAQAGDYPVLVRLAQGPGEMLSDSVSTHRGMSIKVFGVHGEMLPGHVSGTQDFVFATGRVFPQSGAATFLTAIKGIERATGLPEIVKQAVSATARVAEEAVAALGGDSPALGFFGHTRRNPLGDAYFSQAALRYGDHVAKMGAFPVSSELLGMVNETLDTGADPDAFRHAVVQHMRGHEAVFELRVQLCTDLAAMPVEDASVAWPEDRSPYVAVARLTLPAQEAYSQARQAYFDDRLSFQPAHALAAHRPLGSLMRARLSTYQALNAYRLMQNNAQRAAPRDVSEVPD